MSPAVLLVKGKSVVLDALLRNSPFSNSVDRFFRELLERLMDSVTLGVLSHCFFSKQRAYNAVVCDRSSCLHTTLLQRFVPLARVFKNHSIQNNRINKVPT